MEQETMPAGRNGAPKQRVDWRTGKPMLCRDAAFWQEHERRRLESGLSVPQYCKANDLALSTYRHRVKGQRSGHGSSAAMRQPGAAVAFSLIETAKLNAVEPYAYLKDVLSRINDHRCDRLVELLPMHWKPA